AIHMESTKESKQLSTTFAQTVARRSRWRRHRWLLTPCPLFRVQLRVALVGKKRLERKDSSLQPHRWNGKQLQAQTASHPLVETPPDRPRLHASISQFPVKE